MVSQKKQSLRVGDFTFESGMSTNEQNELLDVDNGPNAEDGYAF